MAEDKKPNKNSYTLIPGAKAQKPEPNSRFRKTVLGATAGLAALGGAAGLYLNNRDKPEAPPPAPTPAVAPEVPKEKPSKPAVDNSKKTPVVPPAQDEPTPIVRASSAIQHSPEKPPISHVERIEKNTKPITQEQVSATYNELYEKVSQELKNAEREGKHLAIIMGETHHSRNSLLLEFMLVDIAHRLGIRHMGLETDTMSLVNVGKVVGNEALKARDEDLKKFKITFPDTPEGRFRKLLCLIPTMNKLQHDPAYLAALDKTMYVPNMIVASSLAMGLSELTPKSAWIFNPIDPLHTLRVEASEASTSEKRKEIISPANETPMAEALDSLEDKYHTLSFIGAGHLPFFKQYMDREHVHSFIINGSAGLEDVMESLVEPAMSERLRETKKYYAPAELKSLHQTHPAHALAMVMKAGLDHRVKLGEITSSSDRHAPYDGNNFSEAFALLRNFTRKAAKDAVPFR